MSPFQGLLIIILAIMVAYMAQAFFEYRMGAKNSEVISKERMVEQVGEEWKEFDAECEVSKGSRPYLIGRGGPFETVLWKARRKSRPKVFGYAMTANEAVRDLRENVQPACNIRLYEEWKRKKAKHKTKGEE